ncbi:MAG: hypothetical protein KKA73_30745 [Chloroflexi bacterium]|nr:hypothetical protein [Chloroflexota bacterium]MBU1752080.1 hypothetical protein [Chloroflexota bacterium]MBU1877638.1 hypothetical protein [Chloroflexota bacterium]
MAIDPGGGASVVNRSTWQLQTLGLLAALFTCSLVTGILIACGGPGLLVRWRGDAAVTGVLLDAAGQPWPHQPVTLIVQQADGRTYRAAAETSDTGWLRITVPADVVRPDPASARLETVGTDGSTWWVPVTDLRSGHTLRGSWQPGRP